MRNINISISEIEYDRLGIKKDNLSYTDLVELISRELFRQTLKRSIELAEKFGFSDLSMDDISNEVKAIRRNAKNNH